MPRGKKTQEEDEPPLVASEGVGSGGKGHIVSGSMSVFRLPPPIPGKPGGGYPQEWHDAANRIGSNFRVFAARKARAMQEVALDASMEAGPGPETTSDQQRVRKRDVIFQAAGSGLSFVKGIADRVTQHDVVKKNVDRASGIASSAVDRASGIASSAKTYTKGVATSAKTYTVGVVQGAQTYTAKVREGVSEATRGVLNKGRTVAGELSAERRGQYVGWMMERIKTPVGAVGAVGMFLARRSQLGGPSPFELVLQPQEGQKRAEAIDIGARKDLKSTFVVNPGDTLNWTFAVKSHDIHFHVRARTMREVGGADDVELVPSVKVDAATMGEGTYTAQEAGQVVLVWDNSYSLLRGKAVAYRVWIVKASEMEEIDAAGASAPELQDHAGEDAAAADAAAAAEKKKKAEEEAAAAAKKAEEEAAEAKKKAEEEAAEAKKKAEEEAAEAKKKAEEEAAAAAAAAAKAEEEAAAKEQAAAEEFFEGEEDSADV